MASLGQGLMSTACNSVPPRALPSGQGSCFNMQASDAYHQVSFTSLGCIV